MIIKYKMWGLCIFLGMNLTIVFSQSQIEVEGVNNSQVVRFEGEEGNYRFLQSLNENGKASFNLRSNSSGNAAFNIDTSGYSSFGTDIKRGFLTLRANDDREFGPTMFIYGNLPDQEESGRIRFSEGTSTTNWRGAYLHYDGAANRLHIGRHNTSDSLAVNDDNVMTISRTNGYVGIDEENPDAPLVISESGTPFGTRSDVLKLQTFTANRTAIVFNKENTNVQQQGMGIEHNSFEDFNNSELRIFNSTDENVVVIKEDGSFTVSHENSTDGSTGFNVENGSQRNTLYTSSGNGNLVYFSDNAVTERGHFSDATGEYFFVSDRRQKKNLEEVKDVVAKLELMDLYRYNMIQENDSEQKHLGLLAQEVMVHFPELVDYNQATDQYTMNYSGLGAIAIQAIKEQQSHIQLLEQTIKEIKTELEALKN